MFNRSIQLSVFFVISLMLIAGLFSNTAMAADGAGRITVLTEVHTNITSDTASTAPTTFGANTDLAAGSKFNAIQLTYTAFTDVASNAAGDTADAANEVDDNDTAIDMAGGRIRIAIPSGWKVPDKVLVIDNAGAAAADRVALYNTSDATLGDDVTAPTDATKAMVIFKADSHIIVDLGTAWSDNERPTAAAGNDAAAQALVGRQLQITFYEVTTPIPVVKHNYKFSSSSRMRNGSLRLLADDDAPKDNQPEVTVGNILGAKGETDTSTPPVPTQDARRDTVSREVTITPDEVFVGEKGHRFSISFTAPGPMSGFTLTIPIPAGLQPTVAELGAVKDYLKLFGGAEVAMTEATPPEPDVTVTGDPVSSIAIVLKTLNKGQTVVVSYPLAAVTAGTIDVIADPPVVLAGFSNTTPAITTTSAVDGDIAVNVNKVTGGRASPGAGSGEVEITPYAMSAGALRRTIDITYTAATDLGVISKMDYDIEITPMGIKTDAKKLQDTTSTDYGYVSGDMPDNFSVSAAGVITWQRVRLAKGKTLKAKIRRIDIVDEPRNYTWDAKIGPSGTTGGLGTGHTIRTLPILSVVQTSGDPVLFRADNTMFPSGSMQTIEFTFIANETPIRDGTVSLTIPAELGSAPQKPKSEKEGQIEASGSGVDNDDVSVSGYTVTVAVEKMDIGASVTITYGTTNDKGKQAVLGYMSDKYNVTGTFRASSNTPTRSVKAIEIELGKIGDGIGLTSKTRSPVTLSPNIVKAGSLSDNAMRVTFTSAGTMDGGHVALEIPDNWGAVQTDDPLKRNYVTTVPPPGGTGSISISEVYNEANGTRVVAKINKLARGQSFDFVYGGGNLPSSNGIDVQSAIGDGVATFMVLSDGDGDEVFAPVTSLFEQTARQKLVNPKQAGKIIKDSPGILKINIDSAQDGTGSVAFKDDKTPDIRAADDNVQLVFIYTPTQTIENGELKFTVPGTWSPPQVGSTGEKGYTEVMGTGGLGSETATGNSLNVPIFILEKDQTITITYGAGSDDAGKVMASTVTGDAAFKFAVKGHEEGNLVPIPPATLTIGSQMSGKGKAVIIPKGDTLHAGDADREIKVVYTAAGEMVAGQVRLTIPAGWSAPTAENVTAMIGTAAATPTFSDQMIVVDSVSLLGGGTVTFVYTGTVQPTKAEDVKFVVASHGGLATDSFVDVSGMDTMLMVDVQEARSGSGSAMVEPRIIQAGATGVNLTFTYTAIGQVDPPREFRVRVPNSWGTPTNAGTFVENKNTYSVVHKDSSGGIQSAFVTKLPPIGQEMVARVRIGGFHVEAGDQIQFIYENLDAPAAPEVSDFQFSFDNRQVEGNVDVRVQDSEPTMLSLESAGTVSADEGEMLGITVGLEDADGDAVAMLNDATVTLTSSSTTGAFSMMADEAGTASTTVTIAGGDVSGMVYYTDSTGGTATITATTPGLTMASQDVTVTAAAVAPDAVVIDSVTVAPTLAMAGEAVTVSAMGSAGQMAMFSVGSIVTDKAMTEDEAGSYSGSFMVVADQHADGMYSVTVNLGTASDMASLTIDSTDPAVTVTAPESAMNGDTVMISATVEDASAISSVMADVSMLDSTQTDPVALAMGDDGAYSASVTISDENSHANGSKTVTVTAMDAAGNSGMGTATVELANTLSYTSMIPAGISLFHVPLDVDGLDTVGDLKGMIGNGSNLAIVYDHATGSWDSRSDDVAITADLGIVLSMGSAATYTFEGAAWDGGTSMISLQAGPNLIGLPVNDPRVTDASDIAGLFATGVVSTVIISTDAGFELVSEATDAAVTGDAAYLVTASAAGTATLLGDGWRNSGMAGAAPIALAGYSVEGQTAVLDVNGSIVDEITGLAREGFRVKVKNLSTKASLSRVTSVETGEGYNMTFVDLKAGNAARIGDVLEISADSPSPLIGVTPVRHIVTADDVKSGILELEDLIAYEIPAETELLRNYPNPFNPETWIPYRLAEDADVSLTIYDVNGELVRSIDMGHQSAAVYESRSKAIYWDGRNRFGEQVASGIYFYNLSTGDFSATRKMVILK